MPSRRLPALLLAPILAAALAPAPAAASPYPIDMGNLTDFLFVFTDGSNDANWQGSSNGYVGDVAINGLLAKERSSGSFDYSGTIHSNDGSLGGWQRIVDNNPGTAAASLGQTDLIDGLTADFERAFAQGSALQTTIGFGNRSSSSLHNLNVFDDPNQVFVIDITSGLSISSAINITGRADQVFVMRWDTDANPTNGYQGTVKFQSGGGINPLGGLTAANFIHLAGNLDASGGGSAPSGLQELYGTESGGFFTGYWLTTGDAKGETSSFSNANFAGGWYTSTSKFSMTSGTRGIHVAPLLAPPPLHPPHDAPPLAPIPLPAGVWLLLGGLGTLLALRRRRAPA